MILNEEERIALINLKTQKAKDTLMEAKGIAQLEFWNAVANRLYYACYYIAGALLLKYSYSAQTHRGVISLLGLNFIQKGKLSRESGKTYSRLFEMRQTGDYDDLFSLSEQEVFPLINDAELFIDEVSALLEMND